MDSEKKEEKKKFRMFTDCDLNDSLVFWKNIILFIWGSGFYFLLNYLMNLIFDRFYNSMGENLYNIVLMNACYGLLLLGFIIFFIVDRKSGKALLRSFKGYKQYLFGLIIYIIGYILEIMINVIISKVYGNTNVNTNESGLRDMISYSPWAIFFPIVIFGPICEEMTYRVGLYGLIAKKNKWVAIIVSAIVFGLLHFSFSSIFAVINYDNLLANQSNILKYLDSAGNVLYYTKDQVIQNLITELLNLPAYILSGLLFGFAYAHTGKITTSLTAHILNNLISTLMSMIRSGNPNTSNSTQIIFRTFNIFVR